MNGSLWQLLNAEDDRRYFSIIFIAVSSVEIIRFNIALNIMWKPLLHSAINQLHDEIDMQ